jgi:hypothetical protein
MINQDSINGRIINTTITVFDGPFGQSSFGRNSSLAEQINTIDQYVILPDDIQWEKPQTVPGAREVPKGKSLGTNCLITYKDPIRAIVIECSNFVPIPN